MAKFLNDVKLGNFGEAPRFVNANINPNEIVKAGTTGSELSDLVYNKAIETAGKIQEMKRQNELADIKIQASKNLQDYELSWADRDKYSDENYAEYTKGLNDIYEKNRLLVAGTKYTNESDVNHWDKQTTLDSNNANFKADGEKAQYDIKKITDETILKIDSLNSEYITNGDNNTRLQILDLYNGLAEIGVPKHEIEMMKVKTLVDSDLARTKQEIEKTLNNENLTIEDKMNKIKLIKQNLSLDTLYETDMKSALEKGYITKDSAEIYKSYAKKSIQDGWISTGGYIQRLEEQVRDENYRIQTAIENEQLKKENAILREKQEVGNYFRSGNDIKAVSILEGREITGYDMVANEGLAKKYYNRTPKDILNNNEYIPTISTFELNDMKNKARIDSDNNITRSETVSAFYENIVNIDNIDEKTNIEREYIVNGVMTSLEMGLMKGDVQPQQSTPSDMINYSQIGNKNSRLNKLGGFVGIGNGRATRELRAQLNKLGNDYYKKQQLSELIVGAMISGRFGITFDGTQGITTTSFRQAYNSDPDFRSFVDDSIEVLSQTNFTKYKKADIIDVDYKSEIDKKYRNKPIEVRRQSRESGVEPYVETYNDYDNF